MKVLRFVILLVSLAVVCGNIHAQTPQTPPAAYVPANVVSYIRSWDALSPQTNPNTMTGGTVQDVRQSTQYYDGLGRLVQTVVKQGSLKSSTASNVDLVIPVFYDNMGREQFKYLPFASNVVTAGDVTNDGNFKTDPFQQQVAFYNAYLSGQSGEITGGLNWAYSKVNYETSPLQRVNSAFQPGTNWVGSETATTPHPVKQQYVSNTGSTGDNVQIWTCSTAAGAVPVNGQAYAAGQLFKNITISENGVQTVEFKDFEGKLILKQAQLAAVPGNNHSGWLNTYYIYDNLNNLRYILQPQAVQLLLTNSTWNLSSIPALLTELAFYTEYDLRNRPIIKRSPGAQPVYFVYDSRDRLVMQQDGNMRPLNNWLVTVYDTYNRIVKTGLLTDATPFATQLTNANSAAIQPDGSSYPSTSANFTLESQNYFDNYSWMSSTPLSAGFDASQVAANFSTSYSSYPYPRAVTLTGYSTLGLQTGSLVNVVGALGEYVQTTEYFASFYDDRNRVIQSQESNISGGTDKTTHQYSFDNKELASNVSHAKGATAHQNYTVLTSNTYDVLGRGTAIAKQITFNPASPTVTLSTKRYDELGQLQTKVLGNNLDQLTYEYNVRGWLLGVNRSFISNTATGVAPVAGSYFGFELAYDKTGSSAPGNTYAAAQFNGNISGMVWKSGGDRVGRKYDYTYDNANRLLTANFNQNTSGATWDHAAINYTVDHLQYDANGNILNMWQCGWQITGTGTIDQLIYAYIPNTNRLQNVQDQQNQSATTLGDFHYSPTYRAALGGGPPKPATAVDYSYDNNGNLSADKNKDITGISYNYLNLPATITTLKGTIRYVYDAMGRKLQKVTTEPAGTVVYNGTAVSTNIYTVTCYLGGFVYQSITYAAPALSALNYFDKLSFLTDEEGRIRPVHGNAAQPTFVTGWNFDYFEKDHLGNTRMILTDEAQTDIYPPATLEGATTDANTAVGYEKQYYAVDPSYIVPQSNATGITAYTNSNGIGSSLYPSGNSGNTNSGSNSQLLYKINGSTNKMGLGMTLKVMAGDKIDVFGKSYYFSNNANDNSSYNIPVLSILSGFLGSPGAGLATAGHPAATAAQLNGIAPITTNVSSYLTTSVNSVPRTATTSTTPRAYVNYILFDNQFNYAGGGFASVGAAGVLTDYANASSLHNIVIPKSGYIYVYCSNESPVDVFFDNIQVVHTRGPVLEETHYYPFGLTMAGLSDKALKNQYLENKYRYNGGNELQNKEFSDGSGLDLYDASHRMYDPQIGRFGEIDELGEANVDWSPYVFGNDDPIRFNDPLGLAAEEAGTKRKHKPGFTPDDPNNLAPYTVTARHTQQNLENTYWYYKNNGIPFDKAPRGIQNWLYRQDHLQDFLNRLHSDLRTQGIIVANVASFFIPVGEIAQLARLGRLANLLRLKKGLQGLRLLGAYGTDADLVYNAANIVPKRGWYDVVVHGSKDGLKFIVDGHPISAEHLYSQMLADGYTQGSKIRLFSCYSGVLETGGAAAQLSRLTEATVVAPRGWITVVDAANEVGFPAGMTLIGDVGGGAKWALFK
jgi:RHS repeat-associated protein